MYTPRNNHVNNRCVELACSVATIAVSSHVTPQASVDLVLCQGRGHVHVVRRLTQACHVLGRLQHVAILAANCWRVKLISVSSDVTETSVAL